MTYWFDAAPQGEPYPVTVRFTGKHTGEAEDHTAANRTFDTHSTIHHVMPGAGRVALTARVDDLAPGPWHVTATPVAAPPPKTPAGRQHHRPHHILVPALWPPVRPPSRRWPEYAPPAFD